MLDSKARDFFVQVSRVPGAALGRLGLTPNAVTVMGMLVTGVAGWQIVERRFFLAGWILAGGGLFDMLDGAVARATGRSTRFGAILDSVTDRASDGIVLGSIAWVMLAGADRTGAALAIVSLVAIQLVSYVKAKAESLGYSCNVGFMERAERIIVVVAGLVFGILVVALAVLAAASLFTLGQRMVHVYRQTRPVSPASS